MTFGKRLARAATILLIFVTPFCAAQEPKGQWVDLFDGKSIDSWVQRGGKATYRAENGEIIGTTAPNTPNTFLCTPRNYSNFQLELEFKVHPELNSGIQIRSNSFKSHRNGRVHGYQVEIDPSNRAYSGGIYDEGRRGWLFPLDQNRAARYAFKQEQWNKFRIEAIGDRIRTWINGVPASDLKDDMTAEGFIALQVHGVGSRKDPLEVRWKNIRIRETSTAWPDNATESNASVAGSPFQAETLQKLADGFRFVEGPAVGPNGKIYFNDIPRNRTHIFDPQSKQIEVFREESGRANGMFWSPNDYLISCEGGARRLSRTYQGQTATLADKFDGKRLNSPNDLVLDAHGGIYFTDPRYGNRDNLEQSVEGVYYLAARGKLSRVADDLVRPNGLILSPNCKTLYVADLGAKTIWAYDVGKPGELKNKRKFASVGSDGMSIDRLGNVYCTFDGKVWAFDSMGKEIGRLTVPEAPANCLIVDNQMYITARTGFYVVEMNVQGLPY